MPESTWKQTLVCIPFCLLLAGLLVLWPGCAGAGEVRVSPGEEFSLAMGQTAMVAGEELSILFVEVTEDSRCPRDVTCIWAGRISCAVELTDRESTYHLTLTQPGLTGDYVTETYRQYRLKFSVIPYPEAGKQIASGEYRLMITVVP